MTINFCQNTVPLTIGNLVDSHYSFGDLHEKSALIINDLELFVDT